MLELLLTHDQEIQHEDRVLRVGRGHPLHIQTGLRTFHLQIYIYFDITPYVTFCDAAKLCAI
jgi:hypothetical protein